MFDFIDIYESKIFRRFLLVLAIASLGAVIGLFVKANEHSNDLTLEKYYEFTHYAILSLIGLVVILVFYYKSLNNSMGNLGSQYGIFKMFNDYNCKNTKEVNYSVIHFIYGIALFILIGSIISYGLTTDVKSDKTEYYKRCTVGSALLLISLCVFLSKHVYIIYKRFSGCRKFTDDERNAVRDSLIERPDVYARSIAAQKPMGISGNIPRRKDGYILAGHINTNSDDPRLQEIARRGVPVPPPTDGTVRPMTNSNGLAYLRQTDIPAGPQTVPDSVKYRGV
jgi:hypothetical protein